MNQQKVVAIPVISDMLSDQRVHRSATTLSLNDFNVIVICRYAKNSVDYNIKRNYKISHIKTIFIKGPFFYIGFNIHLFFKLIKIKPNIILANDIDTAIASFFYAKLFRIKIILDSHELFSEVPELINRSIIKRIWKIAENIIIPRANYVITPSQSIANYYNIKYNITPIVIRNVPITNLSNSSDIQHNLSQIPLDKDKVVILYQGAINKDRGLEELIDAAQLLSYKFDNLLFLIIGNGDIFHQLQHKVKKLNLTNIIFTGRIPFNILPQYTKMANICVSLEKNTNQNYYFSLPNKIFDYINLEKPIIASNLPEINNIFQKYNIGLLINDITPQTIANAIIKMINLLNGPNALMLKQNIVKAKMEYSWENEKHKLLAIFNNL